MQFLIITELNVCNNKPGKTGYSNYNFFINRTKLGKEKIDAKKE